MTKHRYTPWVCGAVVALMLLATILFMFSESLGITAAASQMPYEEKLFSNDRVHTLDIVVDEADWQSMLDNASAKEYIPCNVVIDGDSVSYVGIRPKGNSSLQTVSSSTSDRFSFKMEFDHYVNGRSYYGLDKLALNNIIQDTTYMKDFLTYQMMGSFGADAPLCSFIYITVNGEDWGLYLAVEGIEESFAERNYGADYGQIYKPDSMDLNENRDAAEGENNVFARMTAQEMPTMPESIPAGGEGSAPAAGGDDASRGNRGFGGFGGMMGGMMGGSSDVALIYTDDEHSSYANIFNNAQFSPTDADKDRLIASLKQLNEGNDLEEVVNIDEVLRYFVVHNFVLNSDSYTGTLLHNYYLYEEDGVLSMIAWDYNLAFGGFSMGGGGQRGGSSDATSMVNYPIDTPMLGATLEQRPMLGQLLGNDAYLAQYHALFDEFIASWYESGHFETFYDGMIDLIAPYVEKDPTAFSTYDEFVEGAAALREFCLLRAESIRGQLEGSIPATEEGQAADASGLIDGSSVNMSAMGSQGFGGGMMQRGGGEGFTLPEGFDFEQMAGQLEAQGFQLPEGAEDFFSSALAGEAEPTPSDLENGTEAGAVPTAGAEDQNPFSASSGQSAGMEGFADMGAPPFGEMPQGMSGDAAWGGSPATETAAPGDAQTTADENTPDTQDASGGDSTEAPQSSGESSAAPAMPFSNDGGDAAIPEGGQNGRDWSPFGSSSTATSATENTSYQWGLLAGSVGLLAMGIIIALAYPRRR